MFGRWQQENIIIVLLKATFEYLYSTTTYTYRIRSNATQCCSIISTLLEERHQQVLKAWMWCYHMPLTQFVHIRAKHTHTPLEYSSVHIVEGLLARERYFRQIRVFVLYLRMEIVKVAVASVYMPFFDIVCVVLYTHIQSVNTECFAFLRDNSCN